MEILVLGGSGFVGGALVPALLQAGHSVTLLNRGQRPVPGTGQITADRNDAAAIAAEACAFNAVIDTSAFTGAQARAAFDAFGARCGRWIHLGSAAVYLDTPGRLPNEQDAIGGSPV